MSFKDVIKDEFVTGFTYADISTLQILVALGMSFLLASCIFLLYRLMTTKAFYSKSFGVSLVLMAAITTGIILAMQSSLVISLGMVGALSIVRFRTAIKDPTELAFLYWSIGVGIMCGARLYEIVLLTCVIVSAVLVLYNKVPDRRGTWLVMIHAEDSKVAERILNAVDEHAKWWKVKSRVENQDGLDMIVELRLLGDNDSLLTAKLFEIEGVKDVSLLDNDENIRGGY